MAELTSKQKKHLRGLAQRIKPLAAVGKSGLSEPLQRSISMLLDRHELVKVNIPAGHADARKAMARQLAEATRSELIAQVGRMVVLYRANTDLPDKHRVPLPE